jgi:hypothetical protein
MLFDLEHGKVEDDNTSGITIERTNSWLHLKADSGGFSLLMSRTDMIDFSLFALGAALYSDGHFTNHNGLRFESERHDEGRVNVLISGELLVSSRKFVYTFNMPVEKLPELAEYLEQNADDYGDEG